MHKALSHFDSSGRPPMRRISRRAFSAGHLSADRLMALRSNGNERPVKCSFKASQNKSIIEKLFKHFATERSKKSDQVFRVGLIHKMTNWLVILVVSFNFFESSEPKTFTRKKLCWRKKVGKYPLFSAKLFLFEIVVQSLNFK